MVDVGFFIIENMLNFFARFGVVSFTLLIFAAMLSICLHYSFGVSVFLFLCCCTLGYNGYGIFDPEMDANLTSTLRQISEIYQYIHFINFYIGGMDKLQHNCYSIFSAAVAVEIAAVVEVACAVKNKVSFLS